MLLSAAVIADNSGLVLPDSYRTPLSDLVYQKQPSWRAEPSEENVWRGGKAEAERKGRLKVELLPPYDYSEKEVTAPRNMFMNEDELARPKTNIFRYNF